MFKNFISLGGACDVAMGLKKYYLRSYSGPFDWIVSSFGGVINCIENKFEDYLKKENLSIVEENHKHFKDNKHDFLYLHDVKNCFYTEIDDIKEKYNRRILKFQELIIEPTCFIRRIRNCDEIEYIKKNEDFIIEVLTKSNSNNKIIYLLPAALQKYAKDLQVYVGKPWNRMIAEDMTNILDTNTDLVSYLIKNADANTLRNNLFFGLAGHETRIAYAKQLMSGYFNELFAQRKKIQMETNKKLILIGGGIFSHLFYELVQEKEKIILLIDQEGQKYNNISCPILDMQQAILYIEKRKISKEEILAIISDVWNWDTKINELHGAGISDCIPLSFILQKSLGMWPQNQLFSEI